jgi:hypothetical protein
MMVMDSLGNSESWGSFEKENSAMGKNFEGRLREREGLECKVAGLVRDRMGRMARGCRRGKRIGMDM